MSTEIKIGYEVGKVAWYNCWFYRSFIIGIGCGIAIGLMLALIVINVC